MEIPPTEQNVIMNHLLIYSLRIKLILPSDNYENNCQCTVLDDKPT